MFVRVLDCDVLVLSACTTIIIDSLLVSLEIRRELLMQLFS
jgi:hypothetical protein